jgi:hypothetical protein
MTLAHSCIYEKYPPPPAGGKKNWPPFRKKWRKKKKVKEKEKTKNKGEIDVKW